MPPKDCYLMDDSGKKITEIIIIDYQTISGNRGTCGGGEITWSITPELPEGIYIGTRSGSIFGKTKSIIPRTEFIINATNSDGSFTFSFYITVKECSYGKQFYLKDGNNGSTNIILKADGKVVLETKINRDGIHACIPYRKYDYVVNCTFTSDSSYFCGFYIDDNTGRKYLGLRVGYGQSAIGVVDFTSKEIPVVTVPSSPFVTIPKERVVIFVDVNGIYDDLSISPALPKGFKFDKQYTAFIGTFYDKGLFDYSITVSGPNGKVTTPIVVAVGTCSEHLSFITFFRHNVAMFESMTILDSNKNTLFESGNTNVNSALCLSNGNYIIRMMTTGRHGGWISSLFVRDETTIIGNYTLPLGKLSEDARMTLQTNVDKGSAMKYSRGGADKKWNTVKFRDGKWQEASVGKWGVFDSGITTVYFRKHFSVENRYLFTHLIMDMVLQDGCVAYLNGREILRRNIPQGSIEASTLAIASYSDDVIRRSFVPVQNLQKGDNVISVEVHRSATTPSGSSVVFDLFVKGVSSPCIPRNEEIKVTDSQTSPDPKYPAANAFDGNVKTSWRSSSLPASLTAMFPAYNQEFINIIRIDVNPEYMMPVDWRVEGINDDGSADVLFEIRSLTYIQHGGTFTEIKLNTYHSYHAIRFVFNKSRYEKGVTIEVFRIEMFSCNHMTCDKKWGKAGMTTGDRIYGGCPFPQTGYNQLTCSFEDNVPSWLSTGCLSRFPSKKYAFIDSHLRFNNTSFALWSGEASGMKYDSAQQTLEKIIIPELKVNLKEISYPLLIDTSNSQYYSLDVFIRFTVEYKISDYILEHELALMDSLNAMFRKEAWSELREVSLEFLDKPKLHTPLNVGLIVIVVVAAAVITLLALYFSVRSGRRSGVKSLTTLKTGSKTCIEKSRLLNSEMIV